MMVQASPDIKIGNYQDDEYAKFILRVQERLRINTNDGNTPLFTTDVPDIWSTYLSSYADNKKQYHNCYECRSFLMRYGSLAVIDDNGLLIPALWHEEDADEPKRGFTAALHRAIRRSTVTGVFKTTEQCWGTPKTGVWRHLSVVPPRSLLHGAIYPEANQVAAEKKENFRNVMRALREYPLPHVETAVRILKTDALYRSEKVLGPAEWLHTLHVACAAARGSAQVNLVWKAVATAPNGFCHPRSSMIGTLLDDIVAGKSFDDVSRAFAAKMNPLRYQRPQVAPSSGTIDAAEKIFEKLNLSRSLERRFARIDELPALWRPAPQEPEPAVSGVFGHLRRKEPEPASLVAPAPTMTWEKFQRVVLPTAERIEVLAPYRGAYTAVVTALHPDAPPILRWDREDCRNPFSNYFWASGALASGFNLRFNTFVQVEAIVARPQTWNGNPDNHPSGVIFVLEGARETNPSGSCLFPEILRSELFEVRSVIEAHSKQGVIHGMDQPHAAGLGVSSTSTEWNTTLKVWSGGRSQEYKLDRWD